MPGVRDEAVAGEEGIPAEGLPGMRVGVPQQEGHMRQEEVVVEAEGELQRIEQVMETY